MRKTLAFLLLLPACDAGHLGNPLLLPVGALTTAAENTVYNARRSKVQSYVQQHHADLMKEITTAAGPHLAEAYTLARVAPQRQPALTAQLKADRALYAKDAEALTVALMVHGG